MLHLKEPNQWGKDVYCSRLHMEAQTKPRKHPTEEPAKAEHTGELSLMILATLTIPILIWQSVKGSNIKKTE